MQGVLPSWVLPWRLRGPLSRLCLGSGAMRVSACLHRSVGSILGEGLVQAGPEGQCSVTLTPSPFLLCLSPPSSTGAERH